MVKDAYRVARSILDKLTDLPLLLLRLTLAYGFYGPAMNKVEHFEGTIKFFDNLGIPFPTLNAYMATGTELAGVAAMALGLGTRVMSVPMMVIMLVAIKTVHFDNGFSAGDNGFEIPLYYLLMLFTLLVFGPGRASVDHLLKRKIIDED